MQTRHFFRRVGRSVWQKLILLPKRVWRALRNNPIIYKEFRSRMRTRRAQLFLVMPTLSTAGVVFSTSGLLYSNNNSLNFEEQRMIGIGIFVIVIIAQAIIALFITPAVSAGTISGERERQTYDLLRTTLISARDLVLGKYVTAVAFILLLILLQTPILSLAFLFGGIEPTEIVMHTTVILVTVLYFCSIGMFISSLNHRTLPSTVAAYVFTGLLTAILPALLTFLGTLFLNLDFISDLSTSGEIALAAMSLLFLSSNPIAAMISGEVYLQGSQKFWYVSETLSNGITLYGPSPWLLYAILSTLLTVFFLYLTIRRVQRPER